MKVLFLVSSFPKLSETFILNQITGFIDKGVDVHILAWNRVENSKDHEDVEKYDLYKKTTFIHIPQSKWKRMILAPSHFLLNVFKNPKLTLNTLNYVKYGKMINQMRLIYLITYFTKKNQNDYDAIVNHYGPNGNYATFLSENELVTTNMITFFHGQDLTSFIRKWGPEYYRPLFHSESKVAPVSCYFGQMLESLQVDKERIYVHHMGINMEQFSYLGSENKTTLVNFLTIGRLTEKKGIDTTISVITALRKDGIECRLKIIGDGEQRKELEKQIKENKMEDFIQLLGWQSQEEINQAIEKSDLLLQLSRTASNGDMEGIPVVLMESMAKGKLVLSTKHSGIPELIDDDENGWLVFEDSVIETVEKIKSILDQPESWETIGWNARNKIQNEFNIDHLNGALIDRLKMNGE